jgi:hypothetical protein
MKQRMEKSTPPNLKTLERKERNEAEDGKRPNLKP